MVKKYCDPFKTFSKAFHGLKDKYVRNASLGEVYEVINESEFYRNASSIGCSRGKRCITTQNHSTSYFNVVNALLYQSLVEKMGGLGALVFFHPGFGWSWAKTSLDYITSVNR